MTKFLCRFTAMGLSFLLILFISDIANKSIDSNRIISYNRFMNSSIDDIFDINHKVILNEVIEKLDPKMNRQEERDVIKNFGKNFPKLYERELQIYNVKEILSETNLSEERRIEKLTEITDISYHKYNWSKEEINNFFKDLISEEILNKIISKY